MLAAEIQDLGTGRRAMPDRRHFEWAVPRGRVRNANGGVCNRAPAFRRLSRTEEIALDLFGIFHVLILRTDERLHSIADGGVLRGGLSKREFPWSLVLRAAPGLFTLPRLEGPVIA